MALTHAQVDGKLARKNPAPGQVKKKPDLHLMFKLLKKKNIYL